MAVWPTRLVGRAERKGGSDHKGRIGDESKTIAEGEGERANKKASREGQLEDGPEHPQETGEEFDQGDREV